MWCLRGKTLQTFLLAAHAPRFPRLLGDVSVLKKEVVGNPMYVPGLSWASPSCWDNGSRNVLAWLVGCFLGLREVRSRTCRFMQRMRCGEWSIANISWWYRVAWSLPIYWLSQNSGRSNFSGLWIVNPTIPHFIIGFPGPQVTVYLWLLASLF